jgi:hypothetical protein
VYKKEEIIDVKLEYSDRELELNQAILAGFFKRFENENTRMSLSVELIDDDSTM